MREVPVRRYAQDLTLAILFQVMHIDSNVLTAKNNKHKIYRIFKAWKQFSPHQPAFSIREIWHTTALYNIV